jgi:hypothetical protein
LTDLENSWTVSLREAKMHLRVLFGPFAASVILLVCLVPPRAAAQNSSPGRPDPSIASAPHEKMTFFEGAWTVDPGADVKSGATTPPQHEERCAWLPGGRRHMVCRSWSQRPGETIRRERIQILSYQTHDATYLAHFAFPNGDTVTYVGRVEGDRWVMDMQPSPLLPSNERFREIITKVGNGLRFVEERSVDGGPWSITEDYRYRRVR